MNTICRIAFSMLSSLFASTAFGQEVEKQSHHELGINFTLPLWRGFGSAEDSAAANPYLLTYRFSKGQFGARAGVGGSYRYNKKTEDGFLDSETLTRASFDARLGADYRLELGKHFSGSFGLDGVYKWSKIEETTDSGFDVIEQTELFSGWGGGPFAGLHFWFNSRLGLYAETDFYFIFGKKESARTFKNFPELNDELSNEDTRELTVYLPSALFLVYRF